MKHAFIYVWFLKLLVKENVVSNDTQKRRIRPTTVLFSQQAGHGEFAGDDWLMRLGPTLDYSKGMSSIIGVEIASIIGTTDGSPKGRTVCLERCNFAAGWDQVHAEYKSCTGVREVGGQVWVIND
jgi:hypothetical protein